MPIGTPPGLMPVMVVIETIRSLIRPLTLFIRLAANLIAGHLLLRLVGAGLDRTLRFLPRLAAQTLLSILEIAVAGVQAYVFVVLITLYLKEAFAHEISPGLANFTGVLKRCPKWWLEGRLHSRH